MGTPVPLLLAPHRSAGPQDPDGHPVLRGPEPRPSGPQFAPDGFDQLVRDSGWTLVGTTRSGLDVYQSLPGRDPIPIQTDPELVRRRFFGREVAPSLFAALLVLALLLLTVSIFLDPRAYLRLLPSNWELLRAASLMVMSGFLLYWAVHSLVFWVRSRGGPSPVSCRGPGSGGSSGA